MPSFFRLASFMALGLTSFTKSAFLKRQPTFDEKALAIDLRDKVHMVTGANSGLGYEVAKGLLSRGATVHIVCRSKDKGEKAIEELKGQTGNPKAVLHVVDLSSVRQIKAFARAYVQSGQQLDCLVNNAGSMTNERKETPEGLETNFATNTMNYFAMTEELLPALKKAKDSRVVVVSSGGMLLEDLDSEDLNFTKMNPFDGQTAYAQNKRAQVCLTEYWANEHKEIKFQSMHPGWADTPGLLTSMPSFHERFQGQLRTNVEGADTIVWLAASKEAEKYPSGEFFLDRQPQSKHLSFAWSGYTMDDIKKLVGRLRDISGKLEPDAPQVQGYLDALKK